MYRELNDLETRGRYLLKILGAWTGAIVITAVPLLMLVNAMTV